MKFYLKECPPCKRIFKAEKKRIVCCSLSCANKHGKSAGRPVVNRDYNDKFINHWLQRPWRRLA